MQQHIHTHTIMSIHGMDPSKHQRHMGHGDLCLRTPTVSVFGSFHLLPKVFSIWSGKKCKKHSENQGKWSANDGWWWAIFIYSCSEGYTDGLEVRMSCFPPKFFLWKLEWRTQMDVEILLKFYLSVRIMLVNVDKNVQKLFDQTCLPVVPGSPNLYRFVGLECLRSICLQNLWILYRFEIYVYIIYIIPSSYY